MTAVLNVFLFLLKSIGILLLAILGLVLVTLILVLLVPIRYKGKLDKKEAPEEIFRGDGLVSWLNPLLRVRIRYTEKKLHYTVRLFGFCLKNSDKPKKEKKRKKKEKAKEKKKHTSEVVSPETGEGGSVSETETGKVELTKPTDVMISDDSRETLTEETDITEDSGEKEKKKTLFAKIKGMYEKVKGIPALIKQKVTKVIDTVKLLWYKKEKTIAFFEDELHRTALGTVWDIVKQLLRHILPGKIKGHVEFGTGEPESTGKALGVLGVLYAWYGKGVTVVPDFYEKRVVADLRLKGRIRCGTVLVKGVRLIRDKQVKRLISNFKKLLTILKQKAE